MLAIRYVRSPQKSSGAEFADRTAQRGGVLSRPRAGRKRRGAGASEAPAFAESARLRSPQSCGVRRGAMFARLRSPHGAEFARGSWSDGAAARRPAGRMCPRRERRGGAADGETGTARKPDRRRRARKERQPKARGEPPPRAAPQGATQPKAGAGGPAPGRGNQDGGRGEGVRGRGRRGAVPAERHAAWAGGSISAPDGATHAGIAVCAQMHAAPVTRPHVTGRAGGFFVGPRGRRLRGLVHASRVTCRRIG